MRGRGFPFLLQHDGLLSRNCGVLSDGLDGLKVHPKWRCVSGLAESPGRTPKRGTKSVTGSKKRATNGTAVGRMPSL